VAALIKAQSGDVLRVGEGHIKAALPIAALEKIANLPGVSFVQSPIRPRRKAVITTEGRAATLANAWNAAGFTGQGVKVAVIDGDFHGLSLRIASNEIPASVVATNFSSEAMELGIDGHGCACAEIIYDMAPDAQLYLIKSLDSSDDEAAKNYCKSQGIHIINYSSGYDAMNFHDGISYSSISPHPVTILNDAATNGILWVGSAGNEQVQHALVAWRDSNTNSNLDWNVSYSSMNELWNGGDPIPAGTVLSIYLTWNQWPTTNQDFDLDLYRLVGSTWTYVATANDPQDGTQPPREHLVYTVPSAGRYAVAIYKYRAITSPSFILRSYPYELYWYGYNNYSDPAPGSVCIPADAASCFSVGAIDRPVYTNGPIEYFSSLGPNNGAYTGNPVLVKPDVCGPDFVSTAAYGTDGFGGTSASAPHIAALAALVKGRYPAFSNSQIRAYLEERGIDLGTAGKDNTYGAGPVVMTPVALFSASPTNGVMPLLVTFTDSSTGPVTNRFWNFGDGTTTNITATNITHTYTNAGTNTVTLVVSGSAGTDTNTRPACVIVNTPYAAWQASHFTPAELANPSMSGDTADPDGDGIPNLMEYALALAPKTAGVGGLPVTTPTNGYLTLTYRENKQATDLLFAVQACSVLTSNTWSSVGLAEISRADCNTWWRVIVRDGVLMSDATNRFMRLKITMP